MRIVEVIDHLGTGGAQVLLLRLLSGMDRNAYQPSVCCLHGDGPYAQQVRALGVPFRSLSASRLSPAIFWRLAGYLRESRPDIVHLHLEASTLAGVLLAKTLTRARTVVTFYGLRDQYPPGVWALFRLLAPWVDAYVVGARTLEVELARDGFPGSRLRYISLLATELAGELGDTEAIRTRVRGEEGLAPDAPVLLRVARLHPQKGYLLMLEAMARVKERLPEARLLIVGNGPQAGELEQRVAALGLAGSVRFLGYRADLRDLYLASDVVVVSSHREGVGLSTVEAMACGRPVVACDVGGLAEVIEPNVTGLLTPPDDAAAMAAAIVTLLGDGALRQRLGQAARAFVRREYSVEQMVAGHERLYSDLTRTVS